MAQSPLNIRTRDELAESNLREWTVKARMISRENTKSRRFSSSYIRSFREDSKSMLGSVITARDRWLKLGGLILPSNATLYVAPVTHPDIDFWLNVYGIDKDAYVVEMVLLSTSGFVDLVWTTCFPVWRRKGRGLPSLET